MNMKTAEEYFELAKENVPSVCTLTIIHEEMIRLAQKDAYNQAIDDAVDNAACEYIKDYLTGEIDKNSILKLRKK